MRSIDLPTVTNVCEAVGFNYARVFEPTYPVRSFPLGAAAVDLSNEAETFSRLKEVFERTLIRRSANRIAAAQFIKLCPGNELVRRGPDHSDPRYELLGTYMFTTDQPQVFDNCGIGKPDEREHAVVSFDKPYIGIPGEVFLPAIPAGVRDNPPTGRVYEATMNPARAARAFVAQRQNDIWVTTSDVRR